MRTTFVVKDSVVQSVWSSKPTDRNANDQGIPFGFASGSGYPQLLDGLG